MEKLKELPYDWARCAPSMCAEKNRCARHTSPGHPDGNQVMQDFSKLRVKGNRCAGYENNGRLS